MMRQRINKKITVFVMMLALISGTIYFDFGNTVYANTAAEDESATIEATSEEAVEVDTEEQQDDELPDIDIVEDELLLGSGIQGGSVSYLAYNEESKSFSEMSKAEGEYTLVTDNQTSWGTAGFDTWFVVDDTITISSRITVAGTVNLILCDGCTLNATKGITVTGTDNTLKIYAQSNGNDMGKLNATATANGCSGIGGINQNLATGNIVINGGEIAAQGGGNASGIGSGNVSTDNDGTITINGGIVTATGGSGASGIGRSSGTTINGYSNNINIIINGGIINAIGGSYGSGIGSGRIISGSIDIRIYEGVNRIEATNGGGSAECIGKGNNTNTSATVNLEFYNSAGNKVTGDDKDALFSDETSGSTRTITTIIHHEHSWSYAANGNTITATCSNQDGGHKGDISSSISVSAEGKTYDGTPVTATVTGSIPGIDAPTVIYKEGSTTLAGAPSKAGIYTANITIGGVTASASYVISKAPLTITANPKDIIYGDEPEGAGVIYNGFINEEDESVLGGTLDYDFDYERYGDIGSYNITPKGISGDNYDITFVPGLLTVFKKEIGITWSNTSILYNGSAQKPTASATGLVNNDSCDIEVSGGQTECGTGYTATAISLSNNNYKLPSDASLSTTYEIVKADIEQGVMAVTDLTYNGDEQALVTTDNTAGTVYYRLGTEGDFQTTIPKATNAGNYTVYWYISGGNNYNDVASSSTPRSTDVSIAKRSITVSGISSNDKEYDGNTDAELLFDNVVYGGIVSGDNLSVNANGSFADAKPGADKNVIISGLTLGGDDVANYVLAASGQQKTTTADILIDTGVVTETTENADGSSMTIETYYEDGEISGMTITGVSADQKSETVTSLDKDGNVLSVAEGEINADRTAGKYVEMIAGAPKTIIDNDIDTLADELLTDDEKNDVQAGDMAK
ncbi:MAG: hypothetical protein IJ053_05985, partial [Lachnospiraceae bacterium]|nr:hypothetical protein [Lachnospiraceae bacterium]